MMHRRSILKNAGLTGLLAAGAAPAVHAQQTVRWRLSSSFPRSLDTFFGAAEMFAKQVRALSGGRFEILTFAGGELTPALGVVDAVQHGAVECCHTAPYYFYDKNEAFALGCAVPFGLNSRQMTAWMYEGNGLKLMRAFYARYNIISFPMGNTGAQMGGWFRKEIRSVQDLKGLKFRISNVGARVMERFGVIPQTLAGGDIYAALEKDSLDAAEWVGPYDDLKLGLNKVAPYYYYPGWWEGGTQLDLYVNQKAYDNLSAENKAIVEAAASYAHIDMQAKYDGRNPNALKQLVGAGTKLRPFPSDVMTASLREANLIYDEISSRNADWRRIYADFVKFRADSNLWFRFTEARFDSFMQSQKL